VRAADSGLTAGIAVALPGIMSSRPFLIAACVLSLASPVFAGDGARPARRSGKMKVSTVVDKTVDGVVVERKIFLRRGGGKRKGRAVSLEKKVKALESGTIVTDVPAEMPSSMTLKGRLIEKEGSYRERKNGAVITLVRPGARHISGDEGKRVYSGGRMRKVTRPARSRKTARAIAEEQRFAGEHRRPGMSLALWDGTNGRWVLPQHTASLATVPGSDTIRIETERHGVPLRWEVSRLMMLDALEFGRWENDQFTIELDPGGWVKVAPTARPDLSIALVRQEVDDFLAGGS
jgi:hypothetical protein